MGKKTYNKKKNEKQSGSERIRELVSNYGQIVTGAYLALMIILFPFYAPEGYADLGDNKYYFFKAAGMVCFGMLLPAGIFLLTAKRKNGEKIRLSVTDKAVLFYGVAVLLSYLCSAWKEEAFLGAEGWYMGFVSQIMFVAIYFAVARFGKKLNIWCGILLGVSAAVFLLGLLNRFSIYPIPMYGAEPGFISTLGNINWFCSYWIVVFPIGIALFWTDRADTKRKKAALILYLLLGFMIGIVQGSSSGFLGLGAVFLLLFLLSFNKADKLLRWLELVQLFAVSALLLSVVKSWFPGRLNYVNELEEWLTNYVTGFSVFAAALILYAVLHYLFRKKQISIQRIHWVRNGVAGLLAAAALLAFILLLYYNKQPETKADSKMASLFVMDEDWGNARGTTWKAGAAAFAKMPVFKKLLGVGPDNFYLYAYSDWDIATSLYRVFGDARLTNTHNEWLTVLVNTGVCGLLAYAAIFLTALQRLLKEGKNQDILFVFAISIFSYMVHNMVSFQQVICTPLVFILLGAGEKMLQKNAAEKEKFDRNENSSIIISHLLQLNPVEAFKTKHFTGFLISKNVAIYYYFFFLDSRNTLRIFTSDIIS